MSNPSVPSLARAERLGHRLEHLRRYYEPEELSKDTNVPQGAKISDGLNVVWEKPQTVYADDLKIEEANRVLEKGSRIVLGMGKRKDYELEVEEDDGFVTLGIGDHYEVVPRYNPKVEGGNETAREASPESGDDLVAIEKKHIAYETRLAELGLDYALFMEDVAMGRKDDELGGVSTTDSNEWFAEASKWVSANETRRMVLKLQVQEIAAAYSNDGDLDRRERSLERLGDALATFIRRELSSPDRIALPTDCGQVVEDIATGGKTRQEDSLADDPDVGSNYFTQLPGNSANLGWNYHWAGVILKDGSDNLTLESAGGTSVTSVGKSSWWMELYGTKDPAQTFKKRIHQLHLIRNRQLIQNSENDFDKEQALRELVAPGEKVSGWTTLTSDREEH